MAEIIFFVWIAITPYENYKLSDTDIAYYTQKCKMEKGSIHFIRATPRTYRFQFGDKKIEKWVWSGYNIYCYKIEK